MKTLFLLGSLGLLATAFAKPAVMDNSTDKNFMNTLAMAGAGEIQAGQVAMMRGNKFDRQFGRQMVHDHQMAASQLMKIAQNRGITLPSAPAAQDVREIRRMEGMTKSNFHTAYHRYAVASHKDALALFHDEISHGSDNALKAWARRTLPTIRKHMMEARNMMME
jgi:putative membrane protein